MDKQEYKQRLKHFDWFFRYTDDHKVYRECSALYSDLRKAQKVHDADCEIWNKHAPQEYKHVSKTNDHAAP